MPHSTKTAPAQEAKAAIVNSNNPYVFLIGSPRSGTTMLKRMVSAHPEITITRETHWIPRFIERCRGVDSEGRVTPDITKELFGHHRFSQMKVSQEQVEQIVSSNPGMMYADLVSELFDRYAKRKGKRLAGDKTPKYVRRLPTLLTMWPDAKVIHLVRDGRDVCLSMRYWRMAHKAVGRFSTWEESPTVTAALWWKVLVGLGCEDGQQFARTNYLEVRYEDLVNHSERECRRIVEHLRLPYDEAMLHYHEGRTSKESGLSANAAWLPPTKGLRDWQTQMPSDDIQRFEAAAGDLLQELGYPLRAPSIAPQIENETRRVEEQFTDEAISFGWRFPRMWCC